MPALILGPVFSLEKHFLPVLKAGWHGQDERLSFPGASQKGGQVCTLGNVSLAHFYFIHTHDGSGAKTGPFQFTGEDTGAWRVRSKMGGITVGACVRF